MRACSSPAGMRRDRPTTSQPGKPMKCRTAAKPTRPEAPATSSLLLMSEQLHQTHMVAKRRRIAVVDLASGLQHGDPVRDRQARLDVLLDDEDRGAELAVDLAHALHHFLHELRRKAEGGLVQDHELRRVHERHADREHLLLATRERAADLPGALAQHRKHLVGEAPALVQTGGFGLGEGAELEIVLYRSEEHTSELQSPC